MSKNLSEQVVDRAYDFQTIALPDEVIKKAKECIWDYCGVVIAGSQIQRQKDFEILENSESDSGKSTVFGLGKKTGIYTAALINAMNAHVAELDDGHRFGMMHMGAVVISSVLSYAENKDIDGSNILRAIICGYDISIELSSRMQPQHKLRGYHATATCCTIGAALAIGTMLKLDKKTLKNILSAAATSAAGLLEAIDNTSELKPYNIGSAALNAIASVYVGCAGWQGPEDILGGKRGFFCVMAGENSLACLQDVDIFSDKNKFHILNIYIKIYAACRHCHPAIEAALNLRKELLLISKNFTKHIKTIEIATYSLAIRGHDHVQIHGVSSAKMSTPYAVAVALIYNKAGMDAYHELLYRDPMVEKLMRMISIHAEKEFDDLCPDKRVAEIKIKLDNGIVLKKRVDFPKGEPENPVSGDELKRKVCELFEVSGYASKDFEDLFSILQNFNTQWGRIYDVLL